MPVIRNPAASHPIEANSLAKRGPFQFQHWRTDMLDFLSRTVRATVDVVTLPVSAAVDVVTLGGALVDRDEPYTVSKVKRLTDDATDVIKTLAE